MKDWDVVIPLKTPGYCLQWFGNHWGYVNVVWYLAKRVGPDVYQLVRPLERNHGSGNQARDETQPPGS